MITITSPAEEKIRELMKEEADTVGLRVFVKGGGCHGYQYGMAFESKIAEDDTVIEKGEVKIIMDSQSAPLLAGCEVDYLDSLQGSGFAIKNPQAKTTCGCGSSFSAWATAGIDCSKRQRKRKETERHGHSIPHRHKK